LLPHSDLFLLQVSKKGMAKHPNTRELRLIRLTQRMLAVVALAATILIGVLAVRGNFKRLAPSSAIVQQRQH
jgi:hypothetical protein